MEEIEYDKLEEALSSYMDSKKEEKEEYPSFFGGCKCDEKGITLLLIDETEQNRAEILKIIPDVIFEKALVSKQTLYQNYQKMNKIYQDEEIQKQCVELKLADYCVDDSNGTITIGVQELTNEKEKQFREIFSNIPYLAFEESVVLEDELHLGDECTQHANGGAIYRGTIGFPAIRNGNTHGFITTTHGRGAVGDFIYDSGGNQIGTIDGIHRAGTVDATFVSYVVGASVDRKTSYSDKSIFLPLRFRFFKPKLGKDGIMTQYTTGKLLSHHVTRNGLTDLYKCEYASAPGDSGAPVTWGPFLLAMHIAGSHTVDSDGNIRHRACSVKYQNIRDIFNIHLG